MQARAAYIRSLGTTSILVAASLLMLGVVGALVGFNGWPAGAVGDSVRTVPLQPTQQPVLSSLRSARTTAAVTKTGAATSRRLVSAAGLVKVVPVSSPRSVGLPIAFTPGHTAPGAPPPPAAAQHQPGPVDSGPAPPAPDTQQLQTLVSQVVGSSPPPPTADAAPGQQVTVPIVGLVVSAPPPPSR